MDHLPRSLEWSMTAFGGQIEWSDCASSRPVEWSYEDLEIFYGAGRCHHLAIALHRTLGHRIGVLFETDMDECDGGLPVPHHVFALNAENGVLDIRGCCSVKEMQDYFAGTVGLCRPRIDTFETEQRFVDEVVLRGDACLRPVVEREIDLAATLVESRFSTFRSEHARVLSDSAGMPFIPKGL